MKDEFFISAAVLLILVVMPLAISSLINYGADFLAIGVGSVIRYEGVQLNASTPE